MRTRLYIAAVLFVVAVAGCQLFSGLTGIDLDGADGGTDGGVTSPCEQANQQIDSCNQALSIGKIKVVFPPACDASEVQCRAKCYAHGDCTSLLHPAAPPLSTCLAVCK